jgi:hypothetical protein
MMNLNTVRKEKNSLQWLEDRGLTSEADMEKQRVLKKLREELLMQLKKV